MGGKLFYGVYAIGQSIVETVGIVLVCQWLQARQKPLYKVCIVMTWIVLLLHIFDFFLLQIMGMSVWYAISVVAEESWSNFIEMLRASNIAFFSWVCVAIVAALIPIIGMQCFHFLDQWSKKRAMYLSLRLLCLFLLGTGCFMILLDHCFDKNMRDHLRASQVLPWKTTFLSPPLPTLPLARELSEKLPARSHLAELNHRLLKVEHKPNIYLFVIESLRADAITTQIAPHLSQFREQCNIWYPSMAASNATQFSWFAIYHGVHPFHWAARDPTHWECGSLPLQILKKIGYRIELFAAGPLDYYNMGERILGKGHHLADRYHVLHNTSLNYEKDRETIERLIDTMSDGSDGHVFLIFLDSTHFDYSYPYDGTVVAAPKGIDYLRVACKQNIAGVKARYCNAVHFIDQLLGSFFHQLEETDHEAVVVITGDHGEEFFEQDNIFHASNLSLMQTQVPLYVRLGSKTLPSQAIASHVDIFPTILDHVFGNNVFGHWFDGESLLQPRTTSFTISTRYNGSRAPFEFLLYDGKQQLVSRFDRKNDIFHSHALHLVSLRNEFNQLMEIDLDHVEKDFQMALHHLSRR